MKKLFVVIREDLDHGMQLAQSIHAAMLFGYENPEATKAWIEGPNNIIVKKVPNEAALRALLAKAGSHYMDISTFQEPDLDDQITAAALGGPGTQALLWHLPLAGDSARAAA